ncbi:MAG: ADP-ribosylglycohydrolase family protein, partial [Sphaerochaetaceae bacterium]
GNMGLLQTITARIYKSLFSSPKDKDSPYWRHTVYETYAQYRASVTLPKALVVDCTTPVFTDRIAAGWRGRIVGGALGTELEGYTSAQLQSKFGDIHTYIRKPNTYNDDITYEIAFLRACMQAGDRLVDSNLIADQWLRLIPSGWSAEQVALDNLKRGIYPPESGMFRNAFREWIGAQMRGAICGQVAPGNPELASYLAFCDGQISHHGNGVLGEVFNALLTSMAFTGSDIRQVLDNAIAGIPFDSEYFSVLSFARGQCDQHADWTEAWKVCEQTYRNYNWIHSYPNAAAEVIALYYGNGNFNETMHVIASCGQDVDCNAAQIAVALGSLLGTKMMDKVWMEPFTDEVVTYLRADDKKMSLTALQQDTIAVARQMKGLKL